jgi:hypothetical protein
VTCTVAFLFFLLAFMLRRESIILLVDRLELLEPDRLRLKAGNILFGVSYFYAIFCMVGIVDRKLIKEQGRSPILRLLRFKCFDSYETRSFQVVCVIGTAGALVTVPFFFLREMLGIGWLFVEDGVIENLTALGFLLAGIGFGWFGWHLAKLEPKQLGWSFMLLGVACVGVCMEEISWGQRIFGIETPEALARINTQQELNIHNLFTNHFNEGYFYIGFVFLAANLWSFLRYQSDADQIWLRLLPHPFLLPLAALIAAFSFHIESNELVEPLAVIYLCVYLVQLGGVFQRIDRQENAVVDRFKTQVG